MKPSRRFLRAALSLAELAFELMLLEHKGGLCESDGERSATCWRHAHAWEIAGRLVRWRGRR